MRPGFVPGVCGALIIAVAHAAMLPERWVVTAIGIVLVGMSIWLIKYGA